MNIHSVLLLGVLGVPVAAGAAWLSGRLGLGWNARQRVFNSAAITPTIIAAGAACFAAVILISGGNQRFTGANVFLIQAITASLAAFVGGLIAAYLVERALRK